MPLTKADVILGAIYEIKHNGERCNIRIDCTTSSWSGRTHWQATKLRTGKTIHIKSASKLLKLVQLPQQEATK